MLSKTIFPVEETSPAIARRRLDLPEPFGPIMDSHSPDSTLREIELTTFSPPRMTVTDSKFKTEEDPSTLDNSIGSPS